MMLRLWQLLPAKYRVVMVPLALLACASEDVVSLRCSSEDNRGC